MRKWNPGRLVRLQHVRLDDDVSLRLDIYPNGYSNEYRGFVSFFIENLSDVDIELDYELRIKDVTFEDDEELIQAGAKSGELGYSRFHHNILLGSGLSECEDLDDDDLEIYWTINKVSQPHDVTMMAACQRPKVIQIILFFLMRNVENVF